MRSAHCIRHQPSADPGEGLLAGGVQAGYYEGVGPIEGVCEVSPQGRSPAVAVRLEHGHDAAPTALLGGGQSGPHLARVMGVVVDVRNAVPGAPSVRTSDRRPE